MSWNYRVIKHHGAKGNKDWYGIHEVYYNDKGAIEIWTVDAIAPISETVEGLLEILGLLRNCLDKPVLELNKNGELEEEK